MAKKSNKRRRQGVSGNPAKRVRQEWDELKAQVERSAAQGDEGARALLDDMQKTDASFVGLSRPADLRTSPDIAPSSVSATVRQECTECAGPIRWVGADEARQLGHDVDAALVQMAAHGNDAERVDIWTCERPGCSGFGALPHDYEVESF